MPSSGSNLFQWRQDANVRTGLFLAVLALVAVELTMVITGATDLASPPVLLLTIVATMTAAAALGMAETEQTVSQMYQARVAAYSQTLDTHFLVTTSDHVGRFLWANENFLKRTGYSIEELASKPIGGICSGQYGDAYLSEMWATVQAGKSWSGEFCDVTKGGGLLWLKAIVVPFKNARGEIESLTTIGVDITEQRSAELDLKRANGRLKAFITHAPAAVAMFDSDMRYVEYTERWLKDFRLDGRNLKGEHHYDVFPEIPTHWRDKHKRILAGATETCEEDRFTRADGSEHILRWEVRPWYLPDKSIGGMMMLTEDITERKKLQDNLWRLAKLDPLTSLPNRFHFSDLMQQALSEALLSGSEIGIALIDLDRFKEINDTMGHDAGDDLLKTVAERLSRVVSPYGIVARLGGDEFAVLVRSSEAQPRLAAAISAVHRALAEPVDLNGLLRPCSASIGVTRFPSDAMHPGDLMKNADLALYRAKSLGRDRAEYFTPELRAALDRRVDLQNSAMSSLAAGQFLLYYQPIIPASPAEPVSFEALLRWQHPELGLLAPGRFEEILEDGKAAVAIGQRVIELAFKQMRRWLDQGFDFGRVAINVSSADLQSGKLVSTLRQALDSYSIPPQRVCIEVTERVFLGSDGAKAGRTLRQLKDLGVEIALDDFGTGYASLTHIKTFPIDRLKIDRSFVHDMSENRNSMSIVQAIAQLGTNLDLRITAEGVETAEQALLLKAMGCSSLQGYYFSKPVPAAEAERFVTAHRATSGVELLAVGA